MRKLARNIFRHTVGKILYSYYYKYLNSKSKIFNIIRTPFAINIFMQTMFMYVPDQEQFNREDRWQTASEMLTGQRGDCEDYSIFARDLLHPKYNPRLLLIWGSDGTITKGHAVCIFQDKKGLYYYIDNNGYNKQYFYRVSNVALDAIIKTFGKEYKLTSSKLI